MTNRADLKQARSDRDEAMERWGLGDDAFLTSQYKPSKTMGELSEAQMVEAVEMARLGAFERAIARCLGVDEAVFMSTLKKGKDGTRPRWVQFSADFYEARKEHMKKNLRVISEAADEGDWKPAAWQLERSFGFVKNDTVEVEAGPQILSLMQLAQIPLDEAQSAMQIEAESFIVESDESE